MAEMIILPNNGRPKQIFDLEINSPGRAVKEIVVEHDALSITYFIASLESGRSISIKLEEVGNHPDNVRLIKRLDILTKITEVPLTEVFSVGGIIRVTVDYSGSTTIDLSGRAVSASAVFVKTQVQKVETQTNKEERIYRQENKELLYKIHDVLESILNHQRLITGVEQETGDKF